MNKKILENLKHVSPSNTDLSSYVNGGSRPPNHGLVDFKEIAQIKEDLNIDKNTDKKDPDSAHLAWMWIDMK